MHPQLAGSEQGDKMEYDPLKNKLASAIKLFPDLRVAMYRLMDVVLLRQRYVKREIKAYLSSHPSPGFYDAGAGFCQYSWFVLTHFPQSIAFATDLKTDYLKDFAAYADSFAKGRFSFQSADLQSYCPFEGYNMAVAIDILEHIEDDVAAINNLYQSLLPGGVLIISTPSDTDEAARFTAEHVRPGYNKAELELKLADAGFSVEKSIYSYGKWGSMAWRLMMKYPLQLFAKKLLPLLLPYYIIVYPFAELLMQLDLHSHNSCGTGILVVARKP